MVLPKYLKKHGLTQEEFATRLGCSQSLVSQWLSGSTNITPQWALEIERVTKRSTPEEYVRRQDVLPELYRGLPA